MKTTDKTNLIFAFLNETWVKIKPKAYQKFKIIVLKKLKKVKILQITCSKLHFLFDFMHFELRSSLIKQHG